MSGEAIIAQSQIDLPILTVEGCPLDCSATDRTVPPVWTLSLRPRSVRLGTGVQPDPLMRLAGPS